MTTTETNHALANAKAHMESIRELYEAHQYLTDNDHEAYEIEGDTYDDPEEVEERARESALCVEVRSGWHEPGMLSPEPVEYRIALTTGGPALCLRGELGAFWDPAPPLMFWQDWGTPWTEYRHDPADDDALAWFASLFYYGE